MIMSTIPAIIPAATGIIRLLPAIKTAVGVSAPPIILADGFLLIILNTRKAPADVKAIPDIPVINPIIFLILYNLSVTK